MIRLFKKYFKYFIAAIAFVGGFTAFWYGIALSYPVAFVCAGAVSAGTICVFNLLAGLLGLEKLTFSVVGEVLGTLIP
jgi:hypothetical protein